MTAFSEGTTRVVSPFPSSENPHFPKSFQTNLKQETVLLSTDNIASLNRPVSCGKYEPVTFQMH